MAGGPHCRRSPATNPPSPTTHPTRQLGLLGRFGRKLPTRFCLLFWAYIYMISSRPICMYVCMYVCRSWHSVGVRVSPHTSYHPPQITLYPGTGQLNCTADLDPRPVPEREPLKCSCLDAELFRRGKIIPQHVPSTPSPGSKQAVGWRQPSCRSV